MSKLRLRKGSKTVVIADEICVEATSKDEVRFPYVGETIKGITKIKFEHLSGQVACHGGRDSNFGCKDLGYGIYIRKNEGDFAPDFEHDAGRLTIDSNKGTDNKPIWWKIDGVADSKTYENNLNS